MQASLRVGIEAASLTDHSEAGRNTASIVDALVTLDEGVDITLLSLSTGGSAQTRAAYASHPRIHVARSRMPARLATWIWSHVEWPPAELFCGPLDVFWGPRSVLPPLVKAAGVVTVGDLAFVNLPEACSDEGLAYAQTVPKMVQRANRIITPSRYVADELGEWMPAEASRIRVVHPGVHRAFRDHGGSLTQPRRQQLQITHAYATFVGNLDIRNNVDVLLQAFTQVRATHPQAQLVVVGHPGNGWEGAKARHAKLLETEAVRVVGDLPEPEVAAIVRGARVFVYPSRYEGSGTAPLEAMAAGTPVVAAKTSALPESLGDHARWVHPDDVDGIASAMGDYFDGDPDPATIESARQWAGASTWAKAASATLEVFAEARAEVAA